MVGMNNRMRSSVMITSRWRAIISGFALRHLTQVAEKLGTKFHRLLPLLALLSFQPLANAQVTFFNDGPMADKGYPFSEAVRVNDLLFVAGQVATDHTGELVEGGIEAQSHQVMLNIKDIVQRRGLTMADVVKCTVFLADVAQWGDFNDVYTTYFSKPYPARSALGANGLALGAAVEVECIVAYPQSSPRDKSNERP